MQSFKCLNIPLDVESLTEAAEPVTCSLSYRCNGVSIDLYGAHQKWDLQMAMMNGSTVVNLLVLHQLRGFRWVQSNLRCEFFSSMCIQ